MSKKMVVKRVCIEPDYAERLKRKSRVWGIPESELIRRAVVALVKGEIPPERLLTESDRDRMWAEVMQTMKDGSLAPHTEPGEPIWDRESVYAERLDRR